MKVKTLQETQADCFNFHSFQALKVKRDAIVSLLITVGLWGGLRF
jgi:hypothetical protein